MTSALTEKPLRRDAAANRAKILAAALRVFAQHGLDGSVEEVAGVAGVGMGTLYRRFPTKQALIDELIGSARRDLLLLAQESAARADGTGLELLLLAAGQLQAERIGCLQRIWDHSDAELDAMREFREIVRDLLADAQQQGRIRADITSTDIYVVLWSLRGVIETTRGVAPSSWRRHLHIVIDGLRPTTGSPFADEFAVRPMSEAQARRVTRTGAAS